MRKGRFEARRARLAVGIVLLMTAPVSGQTEESAERERWDHRYRGEGYVYGTEPVDFLRDNVERLGQGNALVLAMGEGRNAVFLAESGFDVTGVDISPVAVEKCRRLAADRGVGVKGVVADLADYDLGEERWNLITDFYFLDRRLFPSIVRALRPGGFFVMEHFSTDHPRVASFGPRRPEYLLEPNELLGSLPGLRVLHYEERIVELGEGMHRGPAALVRLIAKKPVTGPEE